MYADFPTGAISIGAIAAAMGVPTNGPISLGCPMMRMLAREAGAPGDADGSAISLGGLRGHTPGAMINTGARLGPTLGGIRSTQNDKYVFGAGVLPVSGGVLLSVTDNIVGLTLNQSVIPHAQEAYSLGYYGEGTRVAWPVLFNKPEGSSGMGSSPSVSGMRSWSRDMEGVHFPARFSLIRNGTRYVPPAWVW